MNSGPQTQPTLNRGIVKQILSGDTIIVRNSKLQERTISLSNVTAPRLERRPTAEIQANKVTTDEPFAWEAREFVRKKLIGTEISFTVDYIVPGNQRECGVIYCGKDQSAESLAELLVAAGLAEIRKGPYKSTDNQILTTLEEKAKAEGLGKWSPQALVSAAGVRSISWTIDDSRKFVDARKGKELPAVIEHVRDGCTVRAFLLPTFEYITIMLSGIKTPMVKPTGEVEEYADEAKTFVESRLLQRDVVIILEGVSSANFQGTIIHPKGNIAIYLLQEGLAKCVDWSMSIVTQNREKYRLAEKEAKDNKRRLWKDYESSKTVSDCSQFTAVVTEIINPEMMMLRRDGEEIKIALSSIRGPRADEEFQKVRRLKPLYDIHCMFEAREFLRTKLIGKRVQVAVDYIQPANQTFPEKMCCTVRIDGGVNVAEVLVSKGLATVLFYRQDDENRSRDYDNLLIAQAKAEKDKKGLWDKVNLNVVKVADLTQDIPRSRQFLPLLQRAGKSRAVVEHVFSGSRFRVFIPQHSCLATLLLGGIVCPKGERPKPNGQLSMAEPFSAEATLYVRNLTLQREVEISVDSMDKAGNFIGWMFLADGSNLSVSLVKEGLSTLHPTADRCQYYSQLSNAEQHAKNKKLRIFEDYDETLAQQLSEQVVIEEVKERTINPIRVICTEVDPSLNMFCQHYKEGPQLETLMQQMRDWFEKQSPAPIPSNIKTGEVFAARYIDGDWYRAKIERVVGPGQFRVLYLDYGNREAVSSTDILPLPREFSLSTLPAQAREYKLAFVKLPNSMQRECHEAVSELIKDGEATLNVEYQTTSGIGAAILTNNTGRDLGLSLVEAGWLLVEPRRESRFVRLLSDYLAAQERAKTARLNIWRYGDVTDDDATEFGI